MLRTFLDFFHMFFQRMNIPINFFFFTTKCRNDNFFVIMGFNYLSSSLNQLTRHILVIHENYLTDYVYICQLTLYNNKS